MPETHLLDFVLKQEKDIPSGASERGFRKMFEDYYFFPSEMD